VIEVGLALIGLAIGIGEVYVWHAGLLWHGAKRDPRNFLHRGREDRAGA
jgi:hypothetical protein